MVQVSYMQLSDGAEGTRETVQEMFKEAINGSMTFPIISLARNIIKPANPRKERETADRLFYWVKNNINFVRDPTYAELLQSPQRTIELKFGDCDDQCCLLAALNLAIGSIVRIVTVAHIVPDNFSHVYLQVLCNKRDWIAYDTVVKKSYPGWEPEQYYVKAIWQADGNCEFLAGIFDKISDEFERFFKRVAKEVSRVARKVKEERDRTFERLNKEFARWEKQTGPFGKFLVLGIKMAPFILFAPLAGAASSFFSTVLPSAGLTSGVAGVSTLSVMPIQAQLFVGTQVIGDSPWKLTEDEWKMLVSITSLLLSAVLSIVTVGSTSALLVVNVMQLVETAASTSFKALDVIEGIEKRKEVIEQLKAQKTQWAIEDRVRREAIAKLEYDVAILQFVQNKLVEYEKETRDIIAENQELFVAEEQKINTKYQVRLQDFRDQKESEFSEYSKKRVGDTVFALNKNRIEKLNTEIARARLYDDSFAKAYRDFATNANQFARLVKSEWG